MDMTAHYDTREGIEQLVSEGLDGLNKLRELRHEAGYRRNERMQQWCILGNWWADTCGNFSKIREGAVPMRHTVLSERELFLISERISSGGSCEIPPARAHCIECGRQFTMADVHLIKETKRDTSIPLDKYVGLSIKDAGIALRSHDRDSIVILSGLKNDAWIDLTPHKDAATSDYAKDWVVNKNGYREASYKAENREELIVAGTKASIVVFEWTHHRCYSLKLRREERAYFQTIVNNAGFEKALLTEIPNGYCPSADKEMCCGPWFLVDTVYGQFKIGWRKRVISIECENMIMELDCEEMFKGEDVTKWKTGIHAWGDKKCMEYLTAIRESACAEETR